MACAKCGKKTNVSSERTNGSSNLQELYDTGNFVLAKYLGPTQVHNIGSPSGVIAEFGMGIYGRGKHGDIFLVHKDDTRKSYNKFLALEGGSAVTASKILNINIAQASKKAKTEEQKVVEEIVDEADVVDDVRVYEEPVVTPDVVVEALNELRETADTIGTNDTPLTRANAMLLKEFVPKYGYTHQLQVMTKIKSGELLSYKNEDGKTMVYHREE